jgi:hypothetical protein
MHSASSVVLTVAIGRSDDGRRDSLRPDCRPAGVRRAGGAGREFGKQRFDRRLPLGNQFGAILLQPSVANDGLDRSSDPRAALSRTPVA